MENPIFAPSFSGIDTFWRATYVRPEESPSGHVVVMGAPHDMTCSTRQGARYGPKMIRQHSCHFISQTMCAPTNEIVDVGTGRRFRIPDEIRLVDAGDIVLYPNDLDATTASLSTTMQTLVERDTFPIILGGDHYITYPLFEGFGKALTSSSEASRIGYLQIDAHLDLMDEHKIYGRYWHGSNARRISELPFTNVGNMVWLGTNGFTWANEWDFVRDNSLTLFTTSDIKNIGIRDATNRAIEVAAEGVDAVYLSIDIDVVDIAFLPGTGSINFGGITPTELLDAIEVLSTYDIIKSFDLVEVSPALDQSGRTARFATSIIMTFLMPRLFEAI